MGDVRRVLATGLLLALVTSSPATATPGDLIWSEARVSGRASKLALGEGALVVLAHELSAYAYALRVYNPVTGELRRNFARGGGASDILVRAGLIIVAERSPPNPGSGESRADLVALRLSSGRERWRIPLTSSATLVDGGSRIFAATEDGVITAHALRTGEVLWRNDDGPITRFVARYGRLAVTGTRLSETAPTRLVVRMLEGGTGAELWRDEDAFDSARGAKGQAVAWAGKRILVGGSITRDDPPDYSYYDNAFVRAYDANSGARLWLDELSASRDQTVAALATHSGRTFASIRVQGTVWRAQGYDTRSGDALWKTGVLFIDGSLSGPLYAGGVVLFAADPYSTPGEFFAAALRASDGTVGWRADAPGSSALSFASAIAADGAHLYVAGSAIERNTAEQRLAVWAYSLR